MHNHHIVPKNMKNSRGKPVREYLQACGISVEDPRNKVYLVGQYHQFVHSKAYCDVLSYAFETIDTYVPADQKEKYAAMVLGFVRETLLMFNGEVFEFMNHHK